MPYIVRYRSGWSITVYYEDERNYLDACRIKVGLPYLKSDPRPMPDLRYLIEECRNDTFRKYKDNRLVMGSFRYGRNGIQGKKQYKRIEAAIDRLNKYKKTGNDELLVDVSNLCELEFWEGNHPNKHFKAEDDKEHVK